MNLKLPLTISLAALSIACQGEIALQNQAPGLLETPTSTQTETPTPTPTQTETPTPTPTETPTSEEPEIVYEIPDFTGTELVDYMRGIAQMLVARPLTPDEAQRIETEGVDALDPVLRGWSDQPGFAQNARYMMQQKLKASGARDGIDFELPGNLVHHVVANDLPWSTVLTADYCVDATGNETQCDTGAPYAAGVLATRAYMAGNASRFNLHRASSLLNTFACRIYPMESTLQPYLEKESLILMFQAESAEEQQVEEAKDAFGNGAGCYACHGQFGAHAQLFVKFDESGMYVPEADGQQDPDGELGRSVGGLMTSHMIDPAAAASESAQMFGQDVANLAEAAQALAQSDAFLPCQVGNIVNHVFSGASAVDPRMLRAIAEDAAANSSAPTYTDLVVAAFTHPRVILSVVGDGTGGTP